MIATDEGGSRRDKVKAFFVGLWTFVKFMLTPDVGPMELVIFLLIIAACLPLISAAPEMGYTLMANMCCVAVLATVHAKAKALRHVGEMAAQMTQEIINQMATDGIIQPGPNAPGGIVQFKGVKH